MKPLVSILIPAFNAENYIAEAITSAVDQTWARTEVIVVDDGSTDRTLAIAMQFASRGVTAVTQAHAGAAAARNRAFSLSRGDYIQWLDADDLLGPAKIERQLAALEESPSARTLLSGSWATFLSRQSRASFQPTPLWQDLAPVEWLRLKMSHNIFMQTGAWLVSRELTEAAGPWDTTLQVDDDGEYFCRVLLCCDAVRFVAEAQTFYRISPTTRLSYIGRSYGKMESQFRSTQMHIGYLRSLEDSDRIRTACIRHLQNMLINFFPERIDLVTQAEHMAAQLGGRLEVPPRLSWKYSWIGRLFGQSLAKQAHLFLPEIRWSLLRFWDRALRSFERSLT